MLVWEKVADGRVVFGLRVVLSLNRGSTDSKDIIGLGLVRKGISGCDIIAGGAKHDDPLLCCIVDGSL